MTSFHELLMLNTATAYFFLGLFSLAVGSFLNVLIYRLPIMLNAEWRADCRQLLNLPETNQPEINLVFPRSFCTKCHTTIPFWHNIPVISFCLLRGKCQKCNSPISIQYPMVELLCLGLSLASAWMFGFNIKLLFILPFIWMLIALFFIDLKHHILPDPITLSLLWLGLIANTQAMFTTLPNAVLSAAGAYMSLWIFIKLFYLATGKIGMGHGDFKLFAAFGAWFGGMMLPFILIFSSLTGAIIGASYLKFHQKTKETPIPFGPFLCISALLALFYGQQWLTWYFNLFH